MAEFPGQDTLGLDLNRSYSPFSERMSSGDLRTTSETITDFATYAAPAAAMGFIDTMGQSLGLVERGDVQTGVRQYWPELANFYSAHEEGAKLFGDIGGSFIPGSLGVKAFRAGERISSLLGGGRAGSLVGQLFSRSAQVQKQINELRAHDRLLASVAGQTDFLGDNRRKSLAKAAIMGNVGEKVKEAVAFEAGVAATMSSSDVLFSDEFGLAGNIAIAAAAPLTMGAVGAIQARRVIRASAQEVAVAANLFRNPEEIPQALFRPGEVRSLGISASAREANNLRGIREDLIRDQANELDPKKKTFLGQGISNVERSINVLETQMKKHVELLARDSTVPEITKKNVLDSAEVQTALDALRTDEIVLLRAENLQPLPGSQKEILALYENRDKVVKNLTTQFQSALADLSALERRAMFRGDISSAKVAAAEKHAREVSEQLSKAKAIQFEVLEPDGSLVRAEFRKPVFQDNPLPFRSTGSDPDTGKQKTLSISLPSTPGVRGRDKTKITIVEDFTLDLGKNTWMDLSLYQKTAVYDGMQRLINSYKPGTLIRKSIIDRDSHHTQLDAFLALHSKYGSQVLRDFSISSKQGQAAFSNLEEIRFASLQQKFEEFSSLRAVADKHRKPPIIVPEHVLPNIHDIVKSTNLPGSMTASPHPVVKAFEYLYQQGMKTAKEFSDGVGTLDAFRRIVFGAEDLPLGTPYRKLEIAMEGKQLRQPIAAGEVAKKPVLILRNPISDAKYARDNLADAVITERTRVMTNLATAQQQGADLVARIVRVLDTNKGLSEAARDVTSLVEGIQRGKGLIAQQPFAVGENAAAISAHELRLLTDKDFDNYVAEILAQSSPSLRALKAPGAQADMYEANLFIHSRRQGWDLEAEPVFDGKGGAMFLLSDTERNRDRFRIMFGEEMAPGETLLPSAGAFRPGQDLGNFEYTPLVLHGKAFEFINQLAELGNVVWRNDNFLRQQLGRGELSKKNWWIPPKNFSHENIIWVMNNAGELIGPATGRTMTEAENVARKIGEAAGGEVKFIRQSDEIQRYMDVRDKAFHQIIDFSDPLLQTGRAKGTQVSPNVVDVGGAALDDPVFAIERQFQSILRRTRTLYFEPEINLVRKQLASSGIQDPEKGLSIYHQYLAAMFGNPTIKESQMMGAVYGGIERAYDSFMHVLFDKALTTFLPKAGERIQATKAQDRVYSQLAKQLGDFNPFTDAIDLANRTRDPRGVVPIPLEMKKHLAALNKLTALTILRFAEVGHSVLTLTSLGATLPAVVNAMKKNQFEIAEGAAGHQKWLARIGGLGTPLTDDTAQFSATKAVIGAMHDIFTPEGKALMQEARQKGFFKQAVAEAFDVLTAPTQGYWQAHLNNATKWASTLSDKSEVLARGISFMVGVNIAKANGIKDKNLIFSLANNFANKVIGDYSPNAKPRIFQGAAGIPLGLFTTFTWNYYQRIFSYIENAQTRALAVQFATQSSLFGAQTVPGWQQYVDVFFTNYDGTANPVDGLNNRLGTDATEWFLNGTLSNLPKMFGADEGVALYPRGDVGLKTFPTLATITQTPSFRMFQSFLQASRETFGALRSSGDFTFDQMAEIAQKYSVNRSLRNAAQLYTGVKIDHRGQVIDQPGTLLDFFRGEANNDVSIVASLMGMATTSQQVKAETFARIRHTDFTQRGLVTDLRNKTRALVRAGKLTAENLNEIAADYYDAGGNPEYFVDWVAQNAVTAKADKAALELSKIMSNPAASADVQRLTNILMSAPSARQLEVPSSTQFLLQE